MKKSIAFALVMLLIICGVSYGADVSSLQKKAEKGETKAQVELGLMYHEGREVKKNFNEAAKWLQKAAEKNDSSAQSHLGTLYLLGEGVKIR